jgi:hypothetical protein
VVHCRHKFINYFGILLYNSVVKPGSSAHVKCWQEEGVLPRNHGQYDLYVAKGSEMSKREFEQLSRHISIEPLGLDKEELDALANPRSKEYNPLWKVHAMIEELNKNLKKIFNPTEGIAIDEQTTGSHKKGPTCFYRILFGKTVKRGFQFLALCSKKTIIVFKKQSHLNDYNEKLNQYKGETQQN